MMSSQPITVAEKIRKKKQQKSDVIKPIEQDEEEDLDAQIRRLEAELEASSSSSDEDSSDDESSSGDDHNDDPEETPKILSLSTSRSEPIESLPAKQLPTGISSSKQGTKRKKNDSTATSNKIPSGLQKAVTELLQDYKPRSAERLPFYCRVCAHQYDSLETFTNHKTEPFHEAAVAMERKASYCKLCRKQLTSPAQLREHLQSRPHKERLATLQARQKGHQRQHQQRPAQWKR